MVQSRVHEVMSDTDSDVLRRRGQAVHVAPGRP